jgi:hypothetical protein
MFSIEIIEVKPMEMPDIRCPNCKQRVFFSMDHMYAVYGSNKTWLCEEKNDAP